MKKLNKKGFTLAELLIVVAIIAVLVAISIPVFSAQLEKSREATDAANIRAAYAEVLTASLTDDETPTNVTYSDTEGWSKDVTATQKQAGWQATDYNSDDAANRIGGVKVAASTTGWTVNVDLNGNVTIKAK